MGMTLGCALNNLIDNYQDVQIMSGRTGECLSSVDYKMYTGFLDDIDSYSNNVVLGISAGISAKKEPYVRIMIDTSGEESED